LIVYASTDEQSYITAAREHDPDIYDSDDSTLVMLIGDQLPGDDMGEWLKDDSRRPGNVTSFEIEQGIQILFFVSRDDNSYNMPGMRQILILREEIYPEDYFGEDDPDYIEDWEFTDTAARGLADAAYEAFVAGGATEDSLIELMEEHSFDQTVGGLYTNIAKTEYQGNHASAMKVSQEIEDWLFAPERHIGNFELIATKDHGYHLVYFVGPGERFRDFIADDNLRFADFTAWRESLQDVESVTRWAYTLRTR